MKAGVTVNLKKSLWDRLKIHWSLYKLLWPTAVAWIGSVSIFVVGLAYSNQEISDPFARSGSVVTAIFILSTVFSVDRMARRSENSANEKFKKLTNGLYYTGHKFQSSFEDKTAENTDYIIRVNIILSAIGLCLGTLVWGFGDLLACSPFNFLLPAP